MYDVLKGDYAKPNGITENRLQKAYNAKPSFGDSERWFCLSGTFRCGIKSSVLPRKENNEIKSTVHSKCRRFNPQQTFPSRRFLQGLPPPTADTLNASREHQGQAQNPPLFF